MINSDLLQKMVSYASVDKEDIVLEVGAGLGFLTCLLSQKSMKVIAVEVDPRLTEILKRRLGGLPNVDLIEGDILSVPIPKFNKVVSIPPYSISSPLLFWLLEKRFECAVLTFQKEFAERLAASVGTKDYGRLTVATYYSAEVDLLDHVPKSMFYPPPDVDSIVVRLKPRKPPFLVENEKTFFELLQTLFTQRNRKIRNAILPFLHKKEVKNANAVRLADSLTFSEKRVRELAPEDFGALTNEVVQKMRGQIRT